MVNSQFAKLPTFDGFVWYHDPVANDASGVAVPKIIGYQCKLGKGGTSWAVPDSISKGVLIRGVPADKTFKKDKWEYLSNTQVKEFVGYSLEPLVPVNWPDITEE